MLQFITDSKTAEGTADQALAALKGGCRWIQVRMKDASDEEVEKAVKAILPHCKEAQAVLIVDDRVEIAVRCGADGVHLGKEDMDPGDARAVLVPDRIIGSTVNTIEDIDRLPLDLIDYLGIGPYRFTSTKKRLAPTLGLEGYREIMTQLRKRSSIPAVAIGGITPDDIIPIMSTGVTGLAVSGAINKAVDPEAATRRILGLLSAIQAESCLIKLNQSES